MGAVLIGNLIGGIGLFLLGMQLMTDGLKIAAGHALRTILERSTSTPLRGLLSGMVITSLVHSSGAVTVATIGFVNAGLMSLGQAITVIYGSNIGTTMTGWLVSLVGFQVHISVFALPLLGLGMFLRLGKGNTRRAALGEAMAGFGLFFVGIDVLKTSFEGAGIGFPLEHFGHGGLDQLVFLGVGFLLTVLMQSSSAAMALTLTATASGLVSLENGAAVVIGANIGTTSTAAFAALGATANAKRVAAAHVIFNLATGVVALAILPLILHLIGALPALVHLHGNPTMLLALFHTVFNLLGVLLLWPFTSLLVKMLLGWFRSHEEDEARPLYLDSNIATTPVLAFQALAKELARMGGIARRMAKGAMSSEAGPGLQLEPDREILLRLELEVGKFISLVRRGKLPETLDHVLPNALRVTSYYREMADVSLRIATMQEQGRTPDNPAVAEEASRYRQKVVKLLKLADVERQGFSADDCLAWFEEAEELYRHLKSSLLKAGTKGSLPVTQMVAQIDLMSDIRRLSDQSTKAACYLATLTSTSTDEDVGEG